jgi:Tfp pilus assembly protein PilE
MRRGLLLVLATVALSGCHEQWGTTTWGGAPADSDEQAAEANVRASIPAIEAYYADNGSYDGATLDVLRSVYDPQIPDVVIAHAEAEVYCIESTVGAASYFKNGPGANITPGTCVGGNNAVPPPPAHTDAEAAILDVIPAIEAFHAESGTYAGLDSNTVIHGVSMSQVRIYVRKNGTAYCVEAPRQAPSAHFVGLQGRLVDGPC